MALPALARIGARLALACGLAAGFTAASAQILVGQTAGFSGQVAAGVRETTDGALLWIDQVNARGGVHGQKIELISLDDKFEPPLAAANAKKLIAERGVVAMFLTRGTPHTEAIRPLLEEYKVPLVGPSTGAMSLHQPVHPYIFNVRSTYQREAERMVQHLATIGITRIALLNVDDSFGGDAAAGAAKGFAAAKLEPVMHGKFDRSKPELAPLMEQVVKTDAQAVLFFGSGQVVIDGIKALRAKGSKAQVLTLSNNASSGFVKQLGENGHGIVISQIFPSERAVQLPFVKEGLDLARAKGMPGLTPAMMEGMAAARVLVEALQRAGPRPTREGVTAALNSMASLDIGGLKVSFSPADHTGLNFTELSIVGSDGRFMR